MPKRQQRSANGRAKSKKGLPENYDRRIWIVGGAATAILAGAYGIAQFLRPSPAKPSKSKYTQLESAVHVPEPQYQFTLQQVKAGQVSPEMYLDERLRLMPE